MWVERERRVIENSTKGRLVWERREKLNDLGLVVYVDEYIGRREKSCDWGSVEYVG